MSFSIKIVFKLHKHFVSHNEVCSVNLQEYSVRIFHSRLLLHQTPQVIYLLHRLIYIKTPRVLYFYSKVYMSALKTVDLIYFYLLSYFYFYFIFIFLFLDLGLVLQTLFNLYLHN